jgi:tartrate dehydrogenase/decarboxylase/D-malate dehydrogenase
LWGLLIAIRRGFHQYANIRPVRLLPGVTSPLRGREEGDIDFIVVRENTEGEYSTSGRRSFEGSDDEEVVQESLFTRRGVDRILRYAFELARSRKKKHVTSATKSNGVFVAMPYWDERFAGMAKQYPDVMSDQYHIDVLTAQFVLNPDRFDVVVGSNLFGDILSDLGPACTGTIAVAPSANLNPEREYPSMFEPVHGSAPDIYGRNIANPIGQIWAGAMMLEHLGRKDAADAIVRAIETVLKDGPRTRDIGGKASTQDVGRAIAETL